MNKKAIKNFVLVILLALLLLVTLTSCDMLRLEEGDPLYASTITMIDAISANDQAVAYGEISDYVTKGDFDTAFPKLYDMMRDIKHYELQLIGLRNEHTASENFREATFLLTSGDDEFYIITTMNSDTNRVAGFNVQKLYKEVTSGAIKTFMALINLIAIAFATWMFIDCAMKCTEKKVLWLILIALGFLSFSYAHDGADGAFNLYFGLTNFSSFTQFENGNFSITVMLPITAIIWLIMRGSLVQDGKNSPEQEQDTSTIVTQDGADELTSRALVAEQVDTVSDARDDACDIADAALMTDKDADTDDEST